MSGGMARPWGAGQEVTGIWTGDYWISVFTWGAGGPGGLGPGVVGETFEAVFVTFNVVFSFVPMFMAWHDCCGAIIRNMRT